MGVLRRDDDCLNRAVGNRARNGQHGRTTILVSIVGLVLGSLVAIAAPAAAAAKTPAAGTTTLGGAGASHVKTGDLISPDRRRVPSRLQPPMLQAVQRATPRFQRLAVSAQGSTVAPARRPTFPSQW